jgi:hypothetical protein
MALCVLIASAGGAALAASPAGATNFYGSAGYELAARVTSVGAEWRVPAIDGGSQLGHARTFVAAVDTRLGVDLEVGTTEDEILHRGKKVASYSAFWTRTGFSPVRFATVRSGDLVQVSGRLGSGGWSLGFVDLTARWRRTIADTGVAGTLSSAQWLQQDPAASDDVPYVEQSPVLAYPQLGAVRFSSLRLDGAPPPLSWDDATYMELATAGCLTPGHPSGDGFSLQRPAWPARQYLSDVAPYNAAFRTFNHVGDSWTASTPGAARAAGAAPFLAAVKRLAHLLRTQHWPGSARADVQSLAALDDQVAGLLEELPELDASHLSSWQATMLHVLTLAAATSGQVHADLGLPSGL